MSSQAATQEIDRGQQTLREAVNSHRIYEPIRGIHPRVELPDQDYEEWLDGNREVEYVVINFSDAQEVIKEDGGLSAVLEPWQIPIILGTEHDDDVNKRTLQDILVLLEVAQPAIYVPDVVYSYNWMESKIQDNAIDAYIDHVRDLQELLFDFGLNVRLIPTNKGWKYDHFMEYRELYDEFNYQEFAFYAVQYTGGDAGNAVNVLRSHVMNSITALDMRSVFLIGRLAEDDLMNFAPRVRGATGLRQWKDVCSSENGLSQDPWPKFKEIRKTKLSLNDGQEQRPLNDFSDKEAY